MRRSDVLLLVGILCACAALMFALRGQSAATAAVYHDGELVARLPLSRAGEYLWREGEAFVRVRVEDGQARVAESSCPDGLCVRMGATSRAGAAIVCLPNRVSVVLEGGGRALDAVSY